MKALEKQMSRAADCTRHPGRTEWRSDPTELAEVHPATRLGSSSWTPAAFKERLPRDSSRKCTIRTDCQAGSAQSPGPGLTEAGTSQVRGAIRKKLLLSVLAIALLVAMTWMFALPSIVRNRVTALTGCPVEAKTIRVNAFAGAIRLEAFHLRNPEGFPTPEFVDLAVLDVNANLFSLIGDEIRVARAEIDVPKVTIVTRQDGVTNTSVVRERIDAAAKDEAPPPEGAEARKYRIDELMIRIGTIELVDYSRGGGEPVRRTIALNADHRFTDVTDLTVVVRPLLADLARANAGGLLETFGGLLPGPFRDALGGALGGAGGAVKKLIDSLPVGR